eukprot:4951474-Prymnesium_polylepis.2
MMHESPAARCRLRETHPLSICEVADVRVGGAGTTRMKDVRRDPQSNGTTNEMVHGICMGGRGGDVGAELSWVDDV